MYYNGINFVYCGLNFKKSKSSFLKKILKKLIKQQQKNPNHQLFMVGPEIHIYNK